MNCPNCGCYLFHVILTDEMVVITCVDCENDDPMTAYSKGFLIAKEDK